MVLARVIEQGSRLSAVRLAEDQAAGEVLGGFNADDLYAAMDWLEARQGRVEQSLLRSRRGANPPRLYLDDATSSLCAEEMILPGQVGSLCVPTPRPSLQPLFASANVTPPTVLPRRLVQAATKKKSPSRRKKA